MLARYHKTFPLFLMVGKDSKSRSNLRAMTLKHCPKQIFPKLAVPLSLDVSDVFEFEQSESDLLLSEFRNSLKVESIFLASSRKL